MSTPFAWIAFAYAKLSWSQWMSAALRAVSSSRCRWISASLRTGAVGFSASVS
jgi:hypothetical protein